MVDLLTYLNENFPEDKKIEQRLRTIGEAVVAKKSEHTGGEVHLH